MLCYHSRNTVPTARSTGSALPTIFSTREYLLFIIKVLVIISPTDIWC